MTNIVENIENAILFVQRHTNLEYKIEHLQREEIPEIPEVALRESIINAVCHRDYFQKGSTVMVEIFDDRVEISNPGGIPSELDPADFGKKSVCRNPVIASLLHRIDYIERIGTGINRIKNAVKEHGKCTVDFRITGFFAVVYKRKKTTRKNDGLNDDTTQITTQITTQKTTRKLTENQKKILAFLEKNPSAGREKIAEQIEGITADGVKYNLKQLQEYGLLKRIGSAKGGYWEVVK
ncbi:MAG: hypothetical protein JXB88_02755 [Spirochaetales bacterium]|nr:hypothetical protein [Spirochaetales bacterium]